MNPMHGSRKRADEFDLLLSRSSSARPGSDDAAMRRYGDLLEVVSTLQQAPRPQPRAEFSADLRSRLMVAAESALAPDTAEQSAARRAPVVVRRSRFERRLVAAVGGFAVVSATASMSVAAQSALPGDTLYPLKRAIENAQAGVQRDADGKGTTLLDNASGRLAEAGALSRSGVDGSTVATTLQDFVEQATEASDLLLGDFASTGQASSIEELRKFTATSMGTLTSLRDVIPDDARASLIEATQVINDIDVQAQSLCPACTNLPIMETPVFAQKTIDALLDDVLSPVLTPLTPTSNAPTGPAAKPGKGKQKAPDKAPSKETQPSQSTVPSVPAEPKLPQGPAATDDGDKKGGGKKDDGLLETLNVSGSDDPIGDLLTGVGNTTDDLVDDVLEGLGGVGGSK